MLATDNYIDLYYYDESHFGLTPCVPYAWQLKGETLEIPSSKGKYVNVAGFLTKNNKFKSYTSETTINAEKLVEIFNDFAQKTTKKTIVVIDNAPIHKSKLFVKNIQKWQSENDLYLFFLPTYSPELNLIEILWKRIKYGWLDFMAYLSFQNLKENLNSVLTGIGTKFNIQFV